MIVLEQLKNKIIGSSLNFQEACEIAVRDLRSNFKDYHWVGIYKVEGGNLRLTAWDGSEPTEHVLIPIGRGICGLAASKGSTIIVHDVNHDPRYLQCFLSTQSEIVVPILSKGKVIGEIDIDSNKSSAFNDQDKNFLEDLALILAEVWERNTE